MPQIPVPLVNSQATATVNIMTMLKVSAKPASHPRPTGRVKTMDAILSVTEA
jgi:hypothetical protein